MVFIIWIALAVAVGVWGQRWGQSFWTNFFGSLICSPLFGALSVLISGKNQGAMDAQSLAAGESKKCPQCAELIRVEAKKCRFCGSEISDPKSDSAPKCCPKCSGRLVKIDANSSRCTSCEGVFLGVIP